MVLDFRIGKFAISNKSMMNDDDDDDDDDCVAQMDQGVCSRQNSN